LGESLDFNPDFGQRFVSFVFEHTGWEMDNNCLDIRGGV